jgi:RNA polymerase sigma-70 factor (ECF subfamily)
VKPVSDTAAALQTDEELMEACKSGDAGAFDELFRRYRQSMWSYFRRRVRESGRAEELAQEVFVAVFKAARRYEPRAAFRTYLYGIAFNLLSAERRREVHRNPIPSGPLAAASITDEGLWVRQALSRLADSDREIVMLREFEQLRYAEIAALLELPINTVRSRLFRARMELRRLLALPMERQS